jgi:hypothetical protein
MSRAASGTVVDDDPDVRDAVPPGYVQVHGAGGYGAHQRHESCVTPLTSFIPRVKRRSKAIKKQKDEKTPLLDTDSIKQAERKKG